jgi:hypothetical protein
MAKRAVRSTSKRAVDAVDAVRTDAMLDAEGAGRPNAHPSDDDVRVRAYQRYLDRGATHGNDLEDWVEAEKELRGQS